MSDPADADHLENSDPQAAAIRAQLARKFGIESEFIRVEQLASMIGISANSVRCQIKAGRFPMPHRNVGKVIVVKVEDFIAWYRDPSGASRAPATKEASGPVADQITATDSAGDDDAEPLYPETPRERSQRIALEIKRHMRRPR